jgi:hypothetical protein
MASDDIDACPVARTWYQFLENPYNTHTSRSNGLMMRKKILDGGRTMELPQEAAKQCFTIGVG